jgi:hypothetical protein
MQQETKQSGYRQLEMTHFGRQDKSSVGDIEVSVAYRKQDRTIDHLQENLPGDKAIVSGMNNVVNESSSHFSEIKSSICKLSEKNWLSFI